jgi:ABC-type lipoprotein export system ATPase subunit
MRLVRRARAEAPIPVDDLEHGAGAVGGATQNGVKRALDGPPAVRVEQATRSFTVGSQQVHALKGIDLVVPAGSFVGLMGRSGSGKTTLLNMIGGLDRPSTGEVYVNERPLSQLSDNELTRLRREEYGFVFQSFALLPILSTAENVELPLRIVGGIGASERRQRVADALALVGLSRWADHRPYEMSGGQQQRVAIARALVSRPRVLIGDEPTGELDSKTGAKILQLLRRIVDEAGVTLVMATHDPTVEQFADVIYRMQDGQIISQTARKESV